MPNSPRPTALSRNASRTAGVPSRHRRIGSASSDRGGSLRSAVAGVAGMILLGLPAATNAQNVIWNSTNTGGGQTFWSDASRWVNNVVPDGNTTSVTYYSNTDTIIGNVRSTNNAPSATTYAALNAITVNGQGTNSGTSALTIDGAGITFANPAALTFNSLNGTGGGLTVAYNIGTTYNAASTIDATNATAQITYGAQLVGSGALSIAGPTNGNSLVLTSGNTGRLANTTITGGIVEARGGANNFFANSISNFVRIQNNARLIINPQNTAATSSTTNIINGSGPDGNGALAFTNVGSGSYNFLGLVVETAATLNIGGTNTLTLNSFGGATGLSGSGTLTKIGTGNLLIGKSAAASNVGGTFGIFSGNINWNGGTLTLTTSSNVNNVLGTTASTVSIGSGAVVTWNYGGNGASSQAQIFSVNGTGTGTGALSIQGINFGSVNLGGLSVASDATVNFGASSNPAVGVNINSALSGAGTLTKIGNATMYVNSQSGTFTGNLNIVAGIVEVAGVNHGLGANAAKTQTVTVNSGTGLILSNGGLAPQNLSLVGTGSGTGNSLAALTKRFGGTYTVGGTVALTGAASIDVGTNGGLTLTGPLTGSAKLTKNGNGTMSVGTVASPFTGDIDVNAGVLQININNSLGAGPNVVTVADGAAVTASSLFAQRSYPQLFSIRGNGTGNGSIFFTGMDNFGPNTTLGGLTVASDATVNFVRNPNVNTNPNTGVRVLTALAGGGGLTLNGTATLYLTTGTATFTGGVSVNGGILELGNVVNALGSNTSGTQTVNVNGGTGVNLNGNGVAPQLFAISGNGAGFNNSNGALSQYGGGTYAIGSLVLNGDATVSVAANTVTGTGTLRVDGSVSGGGQLTKVGGGRLVLAGDNTSTGPVQVSQGSLVVGAGGTSGALGSGGVTVAAGASLNFSRSDSLSVPNALSGAGTLAATSGSTTLTGSLAGFSGNVQVSGAGTSLTTNQPLGPATGSLVVAGPGATFSFAVPAADGYTTLGTIGSINVAPTATVKIAGSTRTPSNASVLVTSSVNLNGDTGFLDVGNNDVIVKGAGAAGAADLALSVFSGRSSPGTGIGSSLSELYRTPAVFLNDAGSGVAYFDGYDGVEGLTASDVIVKYTYLGDTNIDGVLDGRDLANVLEGYTTGRSGWAWGDVDHSGGVVSLADVTLFQTVFDWYKVQPSPTNYGNGQGSGGSGGAIPEPSAAGLLGLAAAGLVRRRRA